MSTSAAITDVLPVSEIVSKFVVKLMTAKATSASYETMRDEANWAPAAARHVSQDRRIGEGHHVPAVQR